ncbi:MAG: hypothetical protein ABIF09_03525, partial [Gemmatimonadota bacterium]
MGRVTADPSVVLLTSVFTLLLACGPAGPGGSGSSPPPPLHLADMAPSLSEASQSIAELFTTDVPLEFVLAADFDQLGKDRGQESEDRPAQILMRGLDGGLVEIPMQVKTRGIFRLQRRICPDPPLRLNLPETSPQGTVLDGQDK